jgi:uncharacterized repeat protein (TIGR01451 family)
MDPKPRETMRIQSRFLAILTVLALLAMTAATPGTMAQTGVTDDGSTAVTRPEAASYIIQLVDAPLASYQGGVAGLAPTSLAATGQAKLENNAATAAYLSYLEAAQAGFVQGAEATLGRSLEVKFTYQHAFNGLSAVLTPAEAAQVAQMAGVKMVSAVTTQELLTDVGPTWIGAPGIWDGSETPSNVSTRGEGVVVAILDTGINSGHPSFAATDMDTYTHTNPLGVGIYLGVCDPTNPDYQDDFDCNAKLIGVHDFIDGDGNDPNSPEDGDGHGSHTAGTVAGNRVEATIIVSGNPVTSTISGVAPRANIIAYDVCRNGPSASGGGCPGDALLAGVNQVIADHMVVPGGIAAINYSISGGNNPYTDPVELAFLAATDAGIFVSASAGNSGPGAGTVAHVSPWVATVAASTHNRQFGFTLDVVSPSTPANLQDVLYIAGAGTVIPTDITEEIRYDATNNLGCTPFPANFFQNSLALIQRGTCPFADKVTNAANAGAVGVVVFNSVAGAPLVMGGLNGTPPAVMVSLSNGLLLRDYIIANPGAEVRLNAALNTIISDNLGDIMAAFSSRGPVQAFSVLKPDVTAPGVAIWAAVADNGDATPDYALLQGTSMSSPHNAGAAALLKALYPTWSPHQIKSALMLSADNVANFKENGTTPADPFDLGAGRIQVDAASRVGFVLDETTANFEAADPTFYQGKEDALEQLNLASFANGACVNECSWTRTLQSVAATDVTYSVTVSAPAGITITVSPISFTLLAGGTQAITVEADVRGAPLGAWRFASLHFTEQVTGGYTDLVGYFDPSNWTLTNDPPATAGLVSTVAGPPVELYVTGGDSGVGGTTSLTITIPVDGILSFDWGYESADSGCLDAGGVILNGMETELACTDSQVPNFNGTYSVTVSAGDVFGFYADTFDGEFGEGVLGITNFALTPSSTTVDKAMPMAVRPAVSNLPADMDATTHRDADSLTLMDFEAIELVDTQVAIYGPAPATVANFTLLKDPTEGNPYDNLNDVYWTTVDVPAGTARLVAEIIATTSPDLDMFWGTGSTPSAATEVGSSATGATLEYLTADDPAPGTYWVLVQNWLASGPSVADDVTLAVGVVPNTDTGTGSFDMPSSLPANTPFSPVLYWNFPDSQEGDVFYGALVLGTDAGTPTNIGRFDLSIRRLADDVTKEASTAVAERGETITYTLTVMPSPHTYILTDTIPAGLTYVDASATGGATVAGDTLSWSGIPGGSGHTITYQATVDMDVAGGTELTNVLTHINSHLGTMEESTSATITVAMGDARLRVAHLAPFAMDPGTAVTITLNGNPTLTDVAFGDSTTYMTVPAGEYLVEVFPGASSSAAISATVNLMEDTDYSAVAIGGANNWDLALNLYEDDNTAPAAGFAHVRFGHLAPFAEGATATLADIRTDAGAVVVNDVPFDTLAGYMPLPAGEYDLQVTSADGTEVYIDLAPFTLADGDILYAVAAGDGTNQDLGVFAWFTDAVGVFLPLETAPPPTYGVELHVAPSGITGTAGTTVTYTVHITNTGSTTDTFDISATGMWTPTASVSEMELGEGEIGMFTVMVEIPVNAVDGASSMATITATSQSSNAAVASMGVTTTASVPPAPTYTIFLPLISR